MKLSEFTEEVRRLHPQDLPDQDVIADYWKAGYTPEQVTTDFPLHTEDGGKAGQYRMTRDQQGNTLSAHILLSVCPEIDQVGDVKQIEIRIDNETGVPLASLLISSQKGVPEIHYGIRDEAANLPVLLYENNMPVIKNTQVIDFAQTSYLARQAINAETHPNAVKYRYDHEQDKLLGHNAQDTYEWTHPNRSSV